MKSDTTLDCFGLLCPMPIIQLARQMKQMPIGQIIEIIATDEGLKSDLPAWCATTGQEFMGVEQAGDLYKGYVRKIKD